MEFRVIIPADTAKDIETLRNYGWNDSQLLDTRNFLGEKSRVIIPEIYDGGKIAKYLAENIEQRMKIYAKAIIEGYLVEKTPEESVRELYRSYINSGLQSEAAAIRVAFLRYGVAIPGVNAKEEE